MTRWSKPSANHTAYVVRYARDGHSFSAISERCGGSPDDCRRVWEHTKTTEDALQREEAQTRALERRAAASARQRPEQQAIRSPKTEQLARNAFGNNVDPIEYGKATPPDDERQSSTGCAALMACS